MKKLLKIVLALVLAAVVVVAVTEGTGNSLIDGILSDAQSTVNSAVDAAVNEATETAIEEVLSRIAETGDAGALATELLTSDTVSDETYLAALGVDSEMYYQVKAAAAAYGVDLNDAAQLREIAAANVDSLGSVLSVVDDYLDGLIDIDETMSQLNSLLDLS